MNAEQVAAEITRRAWSFGVAVMLTPNDHVMADGLRCSGWFDGLMDIPTLAVAWGIDPDRRLGILLHEYCHLTQWAEGLPLWKQVDAAPDWNEWLLKGKPVRGARASVELSRELEADCERRTIRLARELEAPIDLAKYTRGANAYIHFYNVIADKRKWFAKGRSPYEMPEVLAECNPTFDSDFTKTPDKLRRVLETCL